MFNSRGFSTAAVVVGSVIAVSSVTLVATLSTDPPVVAAPHEPDYKARARMLMTRLGADSESLAMIGLTSQQASEVATRALAYATEHGEDLAQAQATASSARAKVSRLERSVRAGTATAQEIASLPTARAQAVSAEAAEATAVAAAQDAVLSGFSEEAKAQLSVIRANARWHFAPQYRVIERTEADAVRLRDALLELRAAQRGGREPNAAATQAVQQADAHGAVSTAKTRLDGNLAGIKAAVNSHLSD